MNIAKHLYEKIFAENYITGDSELNFGNENNYAKITIVNTAITNENFKGVSFVPKETTLTSLDDFTLNGVTFSIENIIDNTSFDIRSSAINDATGIYTITYKITLE